MKNLSKLLLSCGLLGSMFLFSACADDEPTPPNNQPTIDVGPDIVGMTDVSSSINITASDPDGDALLINWLIITEPNGSAAELTNTSNASATFTTSIAGLYEIEIEVDDNRGGTASGIITLYIGGVLPTSISSNTILPDLFEDEIYPDYYAPQPVQVTAGLTLEAGVVLENGADVRIWINGNSAFLKAEGTISKNIILRGIDKVKGSWRALSISSNNVNNIIDHVQISHTGSTEISGQKTAIYLQNSGSARVSIKNTSISQSAGYAFYIDGNDGIISEFENNNFSDNDAAPMRIGAENLYVLDKNSVFTNNGIQAIEVASAGNTNARFDNSGTIPSLSLPYHFYSSVELRANVTFEAGGTYLFDSGKRLWITSDGALIADGTLENTILISGLNQAAGSWFGIEIASPSVLNKINFTEVSFGGSSAGRGANIYMFGSSPGSQLTLTNSKVKDSQTYGLRSAAGSAILTESNNTFSNNASGDIRQD